MGCLKSKQEKRSLLPVRTLVKGEIDDKLPRLERKFILVGPPSSGKTRFYCAFKGIKFEETMCHTNPDLELSLCHTEFFKSKMNNIMVVLWDSAGNFEFASITKNFIHGKCLFWSDIRSYVYRFGNLRQYNIIMILILILILFHFQIGRLLVSKIAAFPIILNAYCSYITPNLIPYDSAFFLKNLTPNPQILNPRLRRRHHSLRRQQARFTRKGHFRVVPRHQRDSQPRIL